MKTLHLLPTRTAGAAENMAIDFLLLQRYPEQAAPRFRHYDWRGPAFTFGFSQKIDFVRENLPGDLPCELCRRPTGGGIVDHRNDWTYALVLPRGHVLYDARATQSYRIVHECLASALVSLGQPAAVKTETALVEQLAPGVTMVEAPPDDRAALQPGVCFQRAELYDVINPKTGAKIAGAAQKRNKHGLLFQGSIEKSSVGAVAWGAFSVGFTTALAQAIGMAAEEVPWPDLHEDEVSGLIEQYSAPEWIGYR
jgi:lipoate-protein ligase A